MAKVKICGLQREEDISYVNTYKPDYIGFIFVQESKRYVTKEQAKNLKRKLISEIIPVGVFVDEEIQRVEEYVKEGIIDVVQLHGDEDSAYIEKLRAHLPEVTIIKAVRVRSRKDVLQSEKIPADYLLFDSFTAGQQGGTGESFDWAFLRNVERPFFLAGGITSNNLGKALEVINPYAVDISSGVETEGYKDKEKIKRVVNIIRSE